MNRTDRKLFDGIGRNPYSLRVHSAMRVATMTFALSAMIAGGCGQAANHNMPAIRSDGPLSGHIIVPNGFRLVTATSIAAFANYVAIGDTGDSLLKVIDVVTGRLVGSAGQLSEGFPEFPGIASLQFLATRGLPTVWVYDWNQRRLAAYQVSPAGSLVRSNAILLGSIPAAFAVRWATDSTLVAAGLLEKGRFLVLNARGEAPRAVGAIPLVSAEFPALAVQQALQPSLAEQPGGNALAIGARYAGRIDIYHLLDGTSTVAAVPYPFDPVPKLESHGSFPMFVQTSSTRFGYIGIAATATRIYALYSGRSRSEDRIAPEYANRVHVFDWHGAFVDSLVLDHDVIDIAIDAAGSECVPVVVEIQAMPLMMRLTPRRSA